MLYRAVAMLAFLASAEAFSAPASLTTRSVVTVAQPRFAVSMMADAEVEDKVRTRPATTQCKACIHARR